LALTAVIARPAPHAPGTRCWIWSVFTCAAPMALGAIWTLVMLAGATPPDGTGRGPPPVLAAGVKMNLPLLPALSRHVPFKVAIAMVAST
jgi:hypothetical protein